MPVVTAAVEALTRRLPKIVSGDVHLGFDYALAGTMFAAGAWYWRSNRKAALGAFVCGGTTLSLTLLTSYPGRGKRAIKFPLHGKMETVLAGMIATTPEILRLEKNSEIKYFLTTAGVLATVSNLTQFNSLALRRSTSFRAY
jgi:hypothetical protein